MPTPTPTPTPTAHTPTPTSTESPTPTSGSSLQNGAPGWVWWVLAAVVLAVVAAILLLVRRRRLDRWRTDLAAAVDEMAWTCRELLPQLGRSGSRQQAAGGWAVASGRVLAAEDRLTELHQSAPDEAGRQQALKLRDAVRTARVRLDEVVGSGGPDETLAAELNTVVAILEMAMRSP